MQSRNSFSGIDPIIVKYIKYYANCLNHVGALFTKVLKI